MSVGTSLNQRLLIVWLFSLAFLCGLMVLLGAQRVPQIPNGLHAANAHRGCVVEIYSAKGIKR